MATDDKKYDSGDITLAVLNTKLDDLKEGQCENKKDLLERISELKGWIKWGLFACFSSIIIITVELSVHMGRPILVGLFK